MIKTITVALISFILAAVFGVFLIPLLHRLKFGQEIREEGPKWHQKKSGTPTMGGIIFIASAILASFVGIFVFGFGKDSGSIKAVLSLLGISLGFGVIGFIDDYIKVILKRNLGLRAGQKFSLQFLVALIAAVWMVSGGVVDTEIAVPFTGIVLDAGYFVYIPFVILVMLAAVNSVNLTDGLDGLATCITMVICIFYCIISNITKNYPLTLFSAVLVGGLLGFFLYNKFPARVFMGDTGSLFLGGAVSAMAIYMKNPLLLLIVGLVYVMEALSVIIQVAWFKKTGKRIFKMSPIHHHFEMCGWSEVKIVTVFSAVTAALCVLGLAATGI
ncbi:MAG: phospho-N-acetylmuramoyl-pentapeptide-transferase [Clostridia bacterium]|nr:phospho-N-acetylmuramoyl-pentapeptide-transferase [Clostridia bacterium]